MCLPILGAAATLNIAQTALGAASAIGTVIGGVAGARQQTKLAEANSAAARDAYILETHLLGKRQQEEQAALVQKRNDTQLQRMIGEAGAVNSAAAGGVGGVSVAQTLGGFEANEATMRDRLNQSQELRNDQLGYEGLSSQARAQQRIDAVPPATQADYFIPIARGLGQGVSVLSDYRDLAQYDGTQ